MNCGDCIHFQETDIKTYDMTPYIGKGYTLAEIIELSNQSEPIPLYDCPYAEDWCEADYPADLLCDGMFEPKEKE